MAITEPMVEWYYDPKEFFMRYGVLNLADKWAVVRSKDVNDNHVHPNFEVITDWLDDRETAVGFLKLLIKE